MLGGCGIYLQGAFEVRPKAHLIQQDQLHGVGRGRNQLHQLAFSVDLLVFHVGGMPRAQLLQANLGLRSINRCEFLRLVLDRNNSRLQVGLQA
jgi:hypothetical protein